MNEVVPSTARRLNTSPICYDDNFNWAFFNPLRTNNSRNGRTQGFCVASLTKYSSISHPYARFPFVQNIVDNCKSKCEDEIIPLNPGNVYRGLNFYNGRCDCLFDNPTIIVPSGSQWIVSDNNQNGSGPITKHDGFGSPARCVPVVDCPVPSTPPTATPTKSLTLSPTLSPTTGPTKPTVCVLIRTGKITFLRMSINNSNLTR